MTALAEPPLDSRFEPQELTRDQLIEHHIPLVTFAVGRMGEFVRAGIMEREDAIGHGMRGLISAVDNFDSTKGASFASYAMMRIRGTVIDAARQMDIMPRSYRRRSREVEEVKLELANQLGRWPTVKELALRTGLTIDDVKALDDQPGSRIESLDQVLERRDENYELQIEDPDESIDPAAVTDRQAVLSLLEDAMGSLPARDRKLIDMRYNQDLPFRVIGSELNISESRVCQIHLRILRSLRQSMSGDDVAAA